MRNLSYLKKITGRDPDISSTENYAKKNCKEQYEKYKDMIEAYDHLLIQVEGIIKSSKAKKDMPIDFGSDYLTNLERVTSATSDLGVSPKHFERLKCIVEDYANMYAVWDELALTNKQKRDYKSFGYKCRDHIHIPGTTPRIGSNYIKVNGIQIEIGDSPLTLFLRFVVELRKGLGGWVNACTLESEKVINDARKYQPYSNLRKALEGSLSNKDGQNFIESNGLKYRISTHPDFVTYDKKMLLDHFQPFIKKIAEKLPKDQKHKAELHLP